MLTDKQHASFIQFINALAGTPDDLPVYTVKIEANVRDDLVAALAEFMSDPKDRRRFGATANAFNGLPQGWVSGGDHDSDPIDFEAGKRALRGGVPVGGAIEDWKKKVATNGRFYREAPKAWSRAPEWVRFLGALFRWNKSLVCEFSADETGWDHHDYPDSAEGVPMHFHTYRCVRCSKEFSI